MRVEPLHHYIQTDRGKGKFPTEDRLESSDFHTYLSTICESMSPQERDTAMNRLQGQLAKSSADPPRITGRGQVVLETDHAGCVVGTATVALET